MADMSDDAQHKLAQMRELKLSHGAKEQELQAELQRQNELLSAQRGRVHTSEQDMIERRNRLQEQDARMKAIEGDLTIKTEEQNRLLADLKLTQTNYNEDKERLKNLEQRIDEQTNKAIAERRIKRQEEVRAHDIHMQIDAMTKDIESQEMQRRHLTTEKQFRKDLEQKVIARVDSLTVE